MIKKSVITGTIAIFVCIIALSLWVNKSSLGVSVMSLFGVK